MNLSRFLRPGMILLELQTRPCPPEEEESSQTHHEWRLKEQLLRELSQLLNRSGRVNNANKLYGDLLFREKKATTGLGRGVAFPHVRTMQAREFIMGFARSTVGLPFLSVDGRPAHLFFPMAAPPYEDRFYLRVFRFLSQAILQTAFTDELLAARTEHEVVRAFQKLRS